MAIEHHFRAESFLQERLGISKLESSLMKNLYAKLYEDLY